MAKIEGRNPNNEKKINVTPMHITFHLSICVIQPNDKVRNQNKVFIDLIIYNLKENEIEDYVIYLELGLIGS
jgi:hypothetical protein